MTEQAPSLRRSIVGSIDSFLDIASSFSNDFSHFPCHFPRKIFLARNHEVADLSQNVAAPRRRNETPFFKSQAGSLHRFVNIFFRRLRKNSDQFIPICRIAILERFRGLCVNPFSIDKVLKFLRHDDSKKDLHISQALSGGEVYFRVVISLIRLSQKYNPHNADFLSGQTRCRDHRLKAPPSLPRLLLILP